MAAGGRLLAAWLLALATTTTTTATTGVAGSQTPEVGEQTTSTTATATATATNRSQPLEGFEAGPLPAAVASFPLYMRLLATVACLVIFTVGVCGNLLVALVVIKTKYLRNSTNLFLINLSVADLLVLIVCMPTVLIELHSRPETWPLGETMCKYPSRSSLDDPIHPPDLLPGPPPLGLLASRRPRLCQFAAGMGGAAR